MDQSQFYDDLAEYYDLIYVDWEGSMGRHVPFFQPALRGSAR